MNEPWTSALADELHKLRAERQQAQEERDEFKRCWQEACDKLDVERAQRRQAIDALREIREWEIRHGPLNHQAMIAHRAIQKLGEQP